ncbi:Gpi16 subunit, GPI transamidase component [Peniophora sp. CONT]|nr:Gpi16 subunit, GPI transamidase component [Peniophora sp. CONT]
MGDGGSTSVDGRWKGTQNALAGLFCASQGSMYARRTTSPTRAFPPHSSLPLLPNRSRALRHAHMPSENVCTENLTHFLKLLPCPARAGIATLLNPYKLFDADWFANEFLGNLTYTPPVPHASGALLRTEILLPSGERLQVTARVRKSFFRYTEHPPDAQRGWDLPPGVLVSLEPTSTPALHRTSRTSQRVYTRPLLVDLATPDFSMPYNGIIMTCTLIALCFGSVFNMLTRRFLVFDAQGKKVAGGEAVEGETAVDETKQDEQ